jgi:hypothetical protein
VTLLRRYCDAIVPYLDIDDSCHEPLTAFALRTRRVQAERQSAEEGCSALRITELDVGPLVVQGGIKNEPDHPTAHLRLIAQDAGLLVQDQGTSPWLD